MQTLRGDAISQDKMKDKLRSEIKDWKKKYEVEQSECKFFHKSALE